MLIDTFNMFCECGDVVDVLHDGGAQSTVQEAADELKTHISSNSLCRHVVVHEWTCHGWTGCLSLSGADLSTILDGGSSLPPGLVGVGCSLATHADQLFRVYTADNYAMASGWDWTPVRSPSKTCFFCSRGNPSNPGEEAVRLLYLTKQNHSCL